MQSMPDCESLDADDLAILATVIAVVFSKTLTVDQTNVYGNFLVAIGSIMLTIAAQEQALKAQSNDQDTDTKNQLQQMQTQLNQFLKGPKLEKGKD